MVLSWCRNHIDSCATSGDPFKAPPPVQVGAAVLGVPSKPTIKEVDSEGFVVKTLQRAALMEVQTPQVGTAARRPRLAGAGCMACIAQICLGWANGPGAFGANDGTWTAAGSPVGALVGAVEYRHRRCSFRSGAQA